MSRSILVISRAAVGPRMASPGIRAYQIAGALARALPGARVTLARPAGQEAVAPPEPTVRIVDYRSNAELVRLAARHDVAIARNFPPHFIPLMGRTLLAFDGYTPLLIEWLEMAERDFVRWRRVWTASNRWYVNLQLTMADYIFCADERQRDHWIGMLVALALLPSEVYERDPSVRSLVGVVPFGVPAKPLAPNGPAMRGVVPGIGAQDRILLWHGTVTDWNDPVTAIEAVHRLGKRRSDLRLVFMGVDHPDYAFGPNAGKLREAIARARELGVEGRSVFFLPGWVPYDAIDSYLAEADAGICLGYETVESRFAFRTRYVDAFRARVPLVCTRGDVLAERVERDPLGVAVPERDVEAVMAAIERVLDDADFVAECRRNLAAIAEELSWDRVIAPLAEFCARGRTNAAPLGKRRRDAVVRAGVYYLLKKLNRSAPPR
ncbi:MAG: glycosyltransferase family 4 protein [Chloroflexota bacterium]|nr:glycosyltransferase family 4 protein [Dehalococcoidia bacterium]MDW8047846.1 glycosyltransferase family 4 protein [Chloroflexota bacterium]